MFRQPPVAILEFVPETLLLLDFRLDQGAIIETHMYIVLILSVKTYV